MKAFALGFATALVTLAVTSTLADRAAGRMADRIPMGVNRDGTTVWFTPGERNLFTGPYRG
jgi:hypothetical protein